VSPSPLAVAIDLGSTLFKSAILEADERLVARRSIPVPPLVGEGAIREGDADAYAHSSDRLLDDLARAVPCGTPLGLASQRSSFVLWDRVTGEPLTPLISWQDRRAAAWCARHADASAEVTRRTGLVMTAHYVGPKLGALIETDREWRDLLSRAATLLGTLDCWLVWRRTSGRVHEVDRTMAARTAMLDLATGDWSDELLALYGVSRRILPRVRSTNGFDTPLDDGLILRASIADQAAGILPLVDEHEDTIVIIVGTGGFVLRPRSRGEAAPPGYLLAPILSRANGDSLWAHEGTVNGAGAAVDRYGPGPTELPATDPTPEALCLPDVAGLGAPWWRADVGLTFSDGTPELDVPSKRRVVLEGLLFRLRQIVDDFGGGPPSRRVLLAGGLAREPFVASGLAALLDCPIEVVDVPDAGLIGAGRLASGLAPYGAPRTIGVLPTVHGRYLPAKYRRWHAWARDLLAHPRGGSQDGVRR